MTKKIFKFLKYLFLIFLFALGGMSLLVFIFWLKTPDVSYLKSKNPKTTSFIRQFCTTGKCKLDWTPLNEISPFVPMAIILAEDQRFFQHHGFDYVSLFQALKMNLKEGKIVWGGSSITMQLAKNIYLSPKKSWDRKLKEVLLTFKLEKNLSKQRILEIYLNVAQWGPSVFGIQAASQYYFQKQPSELGPLEGAYLASILPNPALVDTPHGQEHFTNAGSLIFNYLVNYYLPPHIPFDAQGKCEFSLNPEEAEQVDYLIAKIFSSISLDILSGDAALMDETKLRSLLEKEQAEFLDQLLHKIRTFKSVRVLECRRQNKVSKSDFYILNSQTNLGGQQDYFIPLVAKEPVLALLKKAEEEEISLFVRSAYRGAGYQIYILLTSLRQNNYCVSSTLQEIALPEESEHGCLDMAVLDFASEEGEGTFFEKTPTYEWLNVWAPSFGFELSYPVGNTEGKRFEPWHWRGDAKD